MSAIYTRRACTLNVSPMEAMVVHHALSHGLAKFIEIEKVFRADPDTYGTTEADEMVERIRITEETLAQLVKMF